MHRVGRDRGRKHRFQQVKDGVCQYSGIIQQVVAAIAVAAPFDVVKAELYDQLRAEGIWGRGNELTSDEEAEVKWVMIR